MALAVLNILLTRKKKKKKRIHNLHLKPLRDRKVVTKLNTGVPSLLCFLLLSSLLLFSIFLSLPSPFFFPSSLSLYLPFFFSCFLLSLFFYNSSDTCRNNTMYKQSPKKNLILSLLHILHDCIPVCTLNFKHKNLANYMLSSKPHSPGKFKTYFSVCSFFLYKKGLQLNA